MLWAFAGFGQPQAHGTKSVPCYQSVCLSEFSNRHVTLLRKTTAVSLDTLYFAKGLSRQVGGAAVGTTHNGDPLDNQQAGTLAVTSGHLSDVGSATAAVFTTNCCFSRVTPHRPSRYAERGRICVSLPIFTVLTDPIAGFTGIDYFEEAAGV